MPGCSDAIVPGITCLLMPVQNALGLVDELNELTNAPARFQNMGNAGRAMDESALDVRQTLVCFFSIYQELMKKA